MGVLGPAQDTIDTPRPYAVSSPWQQRWDLGFLGILFYLVVEYTRLPAMYSILQPLRLGKVAALWAGLGWLLAPRSTGAKGSGGRIEIALSVVVFASLMSAMLAPYQKLAWDEFGNALGCVYVYFLISRIVNNVWRLRVFVFVLLLLNLKLAQFAIRYYHVLRSYGLSEMQVIMSGGTSGGSTGFFANAADFGVAMCVVCPLATLLLFAQPWKRKVLERFFLAACSAAFLVAALVCGSRGAVVGLVGVSLVAWARSRRKVVAALMIGLVLGLGLLVVLPGASKTRLRDAWSDYTEDQNAYTRVKLWKVGLKMFLDHPILGVGPGNFARVRATQYADAEDIKGAFVAHSIYIQALAELGLAGAVPIFLLWFYMLRFNAEARRQLLAKGGEGARRSFQYCLSEGLDLGLVGYLVSGTFITVLYYPHLWVLLGLSVGLNNACAHEGVGKGAARAQVGRAQFARAFS